MKSLELEKQTVWKHELKGKHPIFFYVLVLVSVGAITNFQ
jgi:hypothetical protein